MKAIYDLISGLIKYFEPNSWDEFFWLDGIFGLFK